LQPGTGGTCHQHRREQELFNHPRGDFLLMACTRAVTSAPWGLSYTPRHCSLWFGYAVALKRTTPRELKAWSWGLCLVSGPSVPLSLLPVCHKVTDSATGSGCHDTPPPAPNQPSHDRGLKPGTKKVVPPFGSSLRYFVHSYGQLANTSICSVPGVPCL
jgi:hypothetical protein